MQIGNPVASKMIQEANTIMADSFPNKNHIPEVKENIKEVEKTVLHVTVAPDDLGFTFDKKI